MQFKNIHHRDTEAQRKPSVLILVTMKICLMLKLNCIHAQVGMTWDKVFSVPLCLCGEN
jgi:hypothetical protein